MGAGQNVIRIEYNPDMSRFTKFLVMVPAVYLSAVLSASSLSFGQEPAWLPPLATGGAPECPLHPGSRSYRSEIIRDGHATAFVSGMTRRKPQGCHATAELKIEREGKTNSFDLPAAATHEFSIIDFSPDGSQFLVSSQDVGFNKYQHRDVSVSTLRLGDGITTWHNAWDLFGWGNCDAMVEPQGFLPDGRVVLSARKSVIYAQPHPNCVSEVGLYAVDLAAGKVVKLPDSTKIDRYGSELRPAFQACSSDPDIVGACFNVHGRLAASNGTPTLRIWRIGTTRILGVHDDIMPEALASNNYLDDYAYGDFLVCPFSSRRDGEMQSVCIESAEHVVIRKQ